jgi:hypothetical protein
MLQNAANLSRTSCPQPTGKIKNQLQARKSVQQALADCGDDQALKHAVIAAVNCDEYRQVRLLLADAPRLVAPYRFSSLSCGNVVLDTDGSPHRIKPYLLSSSRPSQKPSAFAHSPDAVSPDVER